MAKKSLIAVTKGSVGTKCEQHRYKQTASSCPELRQSDG